MSVNLIHTTSITCASEVPVYIKQLTLNQFLQQNIAKENLTQSQIDHQIIWLYLELYSVSENSVFVSARTNQLIPPPALQVVYITSNFVPHLKPYNSQKNLKHEQLKQLRSQQIIKELENEQQQLKWDLQQRYVLIKNKYTTVRRTPIPLQQGVNMTAYNTLMDLTKQYNLVQLQLEDYNKKKIFDHAMLGDDETANLDKKISDRSLQLIILKENIFNVIDSLNINDEETDSFVSQKKYFEMEKNVYMNLYKQFDAIVEQTNQLKVFLSKNTIQSSQSESTLEKSPEIVNQNTNVSFEPIQVETDVYSIWKKPHVLFHFLLQDDETQMMTVQEQKLSKNDRVNLLFPTAVDLVQINPFNNITQKNEHARVDLQLELLYKSIAHDQIHMWMETSNYQPTILESGDLIFWKIVNKTPLTQTLYFHKTLLKVFDVNCPNVQRNITNFDSIHYLNNGRYNGLMIPPASLLDNTVYCEVYCVSMIQKIDDTKELNVANLLIQVESTNKEQIDSSNMRRDFYWIVSTTNSQNKSDLNKITSDNGSNVNRQVKVVGGTVFGCICFLLFLHYIKEVGSTNANEDNTCLVDYSNNSHKRKYV